MNIKNILSGAMFMEKSKIVIFTGAGFSAPAQLPIQSKILDEMTTVPEKSIMSIVPEQESEKFLLAFIRVVRYLLQAYAVGDYAYLSNKLRELERSHLKGRIITELSNDLLKNLLDFDDAYHLVKSELSKHSLSEDVYYRELTLLKEITRKALEESRLKVSLEDVFTVFDKSMQMRDQQMQLSYVEMDHIHHSLVRLFAYYFGIKEFSFCSDHAYRYDKVIDFANNQENSVSVVSTNWDTLLEQYLKTKSIKYDLCLNDCYYRFDDSRKNIRKGKNGLKLMKLHGSINWFRCLNCGSILILENEPYTTYLLKDEEEQCSICKQVGINGSMLLRPEIITPSMIKSIDSQVYRNVWKSASEALAGADKVIFLGYSLPIADFELRYLLFKNISEKTLIDVVLYHNDDPQKITKANQYLCDLLPEKRYRELFPKNKISFCYDGFQEYFSNNAQ